MSASNLLNVGQSGLDSSKKSLSTAGHNIANANTEGYSRQRTLQQTGTPIGYGNLVLGTGARVTSVERFHDQHAEKKLQLALTEHNFNKSRNFQLSQVEGVFNEIDAEGFSNVLNTFFNSFRELSKQPDDETIRSVVRDSAGLVVRDFKRTKRSLNELQTALDRAVNISVTDINTLMQQVGDLNVKIRSIENGHGETGDLRDQRDLMVRKLSEFFEITTYVGEDGQFTINAEGVGSLVVGNHVQELVAAKSHQSEGHHEGSVEVFIKGRAKKVSHKFVSGRMRALLDTRDVELKSFQEKVDGLAYDIAKSVNAIHRRGYVNKTFQSNAPQGNNDALTGINFFKEPTSRFAAAEQISLSDEVSSDLKNIATAFVPDSPGDNRISIAISKLQSSKILDEGTATFEEAYQKGIGKIGLETAKARVNEEQTLGVLTQIKAMKERVSGVSIDEETANMIRFQHVYDASARVMSVAEQMFDTVLSIKR